LPLELPVAALVESQVSASHFQDSLDPLAGSAIAFEGLTVAEQYLDDDYSDVDSSGVVFLHLVLIGWASLSWLVMSVLEIQIPGKGLMLRRLMRCA
jgi:hypothetical protein